MTEVYRESVSDLFGNTKTRKCQTDRWPRQKNRAPDSGRAANELKVRESMVDGPYVEGLIVVNPVSAAEALESLQKGILHRITT